jgi:S1-C subfamily serine protease
VGLSALRKRWLAVPVVVALVGVGLWRQGSTNPGITAQQVDSVVKKAVDKAAKDAAAAPARSSTVYQAILPSLVLINSRGGTAGKDLGEIGTGVIINAKGAILTANHVVAGTTNIKVTFADGTTSDVTVTSSDATKDIAVLQPDALPGVLVPAVMGGGPRVGDEVYAVGHPLGLIDSLTAGVVSGLDRSIPLHGQAGTLDGLIQFDAAVNPGNSGGPLLNRNSQVIGIVTALANPSDQGFFIGIGFAVPIATAGGAAGGPPV